MFMSDFHPEPVLLAFSLLFCRTALEKGIGVFLVVEDDNRGKPKEIFYHPGE